VINHERGVIYHPVRLLYNMRDGIPRFPFKNVIYAATSAGVVPLVYPLFYTLAS